jgi:hypothetical protein
MSAVRRWVPRPCLPCNAIAVYWLHNPMSSYQGSKSRGRPNESATCLIAVKRWKTLPASLSSWRHYTNCCHAVSFQYSRKGTSGVTVTEERSRQCVRFYSSLCFTTLISTAAPTTTYIKIPISKLSGIYADFWVRPSIFTFSSVFALLLQQISLTTRLGKAHLKRPFSNAYTKYLIQPSGTSSGELSRGSHPMSSCQK